LPGSIAGLTMEVRLPRPAVTPGPGEEVAWLMEVDDANGNFLGYSRQPSTLDPTTQQVVLSVSASQLTGTLFLPVLLRTAYVRNFDPGAHIWSSPFVDAVDFGLAAPQWTRMQVLAPQIGQRLPVLNGFTGQPGWIDGRGVGPVGLDDGLQAVPTQAAAASPDAGLAPTDDIPPAAPIAPPASPRPTTLRAYTVQPGDTLKAIAALTGSPVAALIAVNPRIDPDRLTIGQQLQLPSP
jgi:hypothetical protein